MTDVSTPSRRDICRRVARVRHKEPKPKWRVGRDLLLIRARVVVEHVEERLNVELREDAGCVQQRMGHLRVIRRCLNGIPRNVVLRPTWRRWRIDQVGNEHVLVRTLTFPCLEAGACWNSSLAEVCALGRGSTSDVALHERPIVSDCHATSGIG